MTGNELTVVIGAHLQCLVSSHDQANLLASFVLQNSDITSSPFLPFLCFLVESEQLGSPAIGLVVSGNILSIILLDHSHLKQNIFVLFMRLCLDLLLQLDNWLKVRFIFTLPFVALGMRSLMVSQQSPPI